LPLVWVTVLVWAMVALLLVSVVGILSARERRPSQSRYAVRAQPCTGRLGPCFGCLC
jgi:cytochrome c-type biogenesis protein CcmH/NrfF